MDSVYKTELQKLYDEIPSFECKEGCTDCCKNIIQFAPEEIDRLVIKPGCSEPCPNRLEGKCLSYETRGFICRIFGASELFPCIYGYGPEKPLSAEKTKMLFKKFVEIKDAQEKNDKRRE